MSPDRLRIGNLYWCIQVCPARCCIYSEYPLSPSILSIACMALWQLLQSVDSGPISIYAWELCYKYVDSGPTQLSTAEILD